MVLDFRGAVPGPALPCQLMPAAPGAAHLMRNVLHGVLRWGAVCAAPHHQHGGHLAACSVDHSQQQQLRRILTCMRDCSQPGQLLILYS
jgi:hypothetical protein